jgi:prepilin-type N-terminal cleavage/methylation domain-containing protein
MRLHQKGFTLIEIMVVIAVVSFLAAVILVALNGVRERARNAKRVADIQQIHKSLELYYNECTSYPQLPPATFGFVLNQSKALYSGTANTCGDSQGGGANGGIGASPHTPGAKETVFLPNFPTAPTPIDDGSLAGANKCSAQETQVSSKWNDYSYYSFSPEDYFVDFCISQAVDNLAPGHHTLRPGGIQ